MAKIHELYGQLVEDHAEAVEAYTRTLALLQELKEGKLTLKQITVREDGWDINAPESSSSGVPLSYKEIKELTRKEAEDAKG